MNSYETWYIEIPNENSWAKLILLRGCYVISVPWLRAGDRGIGIRFLAGAINIFSSKQRPNVGPFQPSIRWAPGRFPRG